MQGVKLWDTPGGTLTRSQNGVSNLQPEDFSSFKKINSYLSYFSDRHSGLSLESGSSFISRSSSFKIFKG